MNVELCLAYPPSVNRYYRHVGAKVLISREGREYREKVARLLMQRRHEKFTSHVTVAIKAYPPDNRRRDLDNILKALLDALVHGGAIEDDSLVECLMVRKMHASEFPRVKVRIYGREQERG